MAVLVLLAVAIFLISRLVSVASVAPDDGSRRQATAVARIKPVGEVKVAAASGAVGAPAGQVAAEPQAEAAAVSGQDVYNKACAACHAAGVLNAPKLGSKEDWSPRFEQGLETLVGNAVNGVRSMPAKGGNPALSDEEIKASVTYMLGESGIEVAAAAPEAPAPEVAAPVAEAPASAAPAAPQRDKDVQLALIAARKAMSEARQAAKAAQRAAIAARRAALAAKEVASVLGGLGVAPAKKPAAAPAPAPAPAEKPVAPAAPKPVAPKPAPEAKQAPAAEETAPAPARKTIAPSEIVIPEGVSMAQGKQLYDSACMACHMTGAAGAPKVGDKEAWAPRLAQGFEVLVEHSLKGFKGMPAKGGRFDVPDWTVISAVGYMVSKSK